MMSLERKKNGKGVERKMESPKKVSFEVLSTEENEDEEEMRWCASEFPEVREIEKDKPKAPLGMGTSVRTHHPLHKWRKTCKRADSQEGSPIRVCSVTKNET